MLEKMSDFFEKRLDGYDEHMMNNIDSAREFYPYTASLLPKEEDARLLDLGCGTGLELEAYFSGGGRAHVTGIDLSQKMLKALEAKLKDRALTLLRGSYFDLPLGVSAFDAAVSVESLHHFTKDEKTALYKKLYKALKGGGYFVLTDYFALNDEEEKAHREALLALRKAEGITDSDFYHYDTPLTTRHEIEALLEAGFTSAEIKNNWGATFTLVARK